ncbi:tyrosine-type recombinase/integrase [Hymenobacter sp. BRD67]|uniref:tyrosine-type recombinase/integrase n=1 Tax=Hymenobacter sp. BRD67 TaxID=2675877 RepID=UPI001566EF9A|nr:tyrosine-type recombinase/integrase [Hymenobacter sp. BRD67]QKG52257.1 tyrosine-type recombinase/integrase [Hymenobacter sp. BRD67]
MSLKVITRNLDSKGFENVYVQYAHNGTSKRFPVGENGLKVQRGGMEDGRLVKCAGAAWKEHNASIVDGNEAIDTTKSQLTRIIRRYSEDNGTVPTPEVLEELWKAPKNAKGSPGAKVTFWQLFKDYEAVLKAKVKKGTDGHKDGYNTARGLKPLGTLLLEFERAHGIKLTLASFDFALMTRFNDFMLEQGHLNSTTKTRIARLKALLNYFVQMGVSKHVAFREYKRDKTHKDAPKNQRIVALNEQELAEWLALELDCKHLRYARALFSLACATGLRFSDVTRVGPHCINNDAIQIVTRKTGDTLTIPLNWLSRKVLAEYPDGMRATDLGKYNARLVALGEMCPSLHNAFTRTAFSGNARVVDESKNRKYQYLSSHVGRKTFVTRCLMDGIPEFKIRRWTGHKNLESFARYVDNEIGEADIMSRFKYVELPKIS